MLQQILQPFVMATFISTTLNLFQSLYQAQGRQRERERGGRRKMDKEKKRVVEVKRAWGPPEI